MLNVLLCTLTSFIRLKEGCLLSHDISSGLTVTIPISTCPLPLTSMIYGADGWNLNQRTSGPVKAHLTPGIYFNAFKHVNSPRAGADNPLGTMLMSTESPYYFASFKTNSLKYDFKHILNDFIHACSPRAGTDNPLGRQF